MKSKFSSLMFVAALMMFSMTASADEYDDTVAIFKNAGESGTYFAKSYAYAVFPTVGKAGLGVGGAHGSGRLYAQGKHVGDVKVNQLSVGLQAGGQAFSQIVFLQDKRAYDEFTNGNFEFDATIQAVAITASATASAGTAGAAAGAAGGKKDATTTGNYHKGMAVFTVAKGGLMYQAAVGGQKFKYKAK
jgi:lipid-binding SYLF domain-containing protein